MDILVATARDFALLRGGRPVAGGTWDDVRQAYASVEDAPPGGAALCLTLRLGRGAEFRARDDAPGWDDFVEAAEAALPGMRPRRVWEPALQRDAPAGPDVVFERQAAAT
jgi:hypothetical protein